MARPRRIVKNLGVVPLLLALALVALLAAPLATPVSSAVEPDASWSLTDYTFEKTDCTITLGPGGGPLEPDDCDEAEPVCDDYDTDTLERPTIQEPDDPKRAD